MKKSNFWSRLSNWTRAFLAIALLFLTFGLGTLGSVATTGDSHVLPMQVEADNKVPGVVLNLTDPGHGEEGHTHNDDLYVKEVYFNLGAVYGEPGKVATVRIGRGTSSSSEFTTSVDVCFENFYETVEEGKESVNPIADPFFSWVKYTVTTTNGWKLSVYPYYKLTAIGCSVMVNEVVFVANNEQGDGEPVALSATVSPVSLLPYDASRGETAESVIEKARAISDVEPRIPASAQSSFFRYGEEEIGTLFTIAEMKRGSEFGPNETYQLEREYNALGISLVALGTAVFGMSPFGLRFVPFLASFGVLAFGFLFVRKLTGKDSAGFFFSLIYVFSSLPFALGHYGTPLTIGLFFMTGAFYFALRYFRDGVKKAKISSALPVGLAGLFSAAAICVNGAYLIPTAGVIGLFAGGLLRQIRARRADLDAAIEEAEAEDKAPAPVPEEGEEPRPSGKEKVVKVLADYRFRIAAASALFGSLLVFGTFLLSALSLLPTYYLFVKLYDNPAAPSSSVFAFLWKAFAGGFAGKNVFAGQSAWSPVYVLFRGTGEKAAVTATGTLMAVASLACGLAGICYTVFDLIRGGNDPAFLEKLRRSVILLSGIVLGFVTASFAGGALGFLFLAYLFLFAFGASAAADGTEKGGKEGIIVKCLASLLLFGMAVCFGLFAVYTFSIPSAGFLTFA